MFGYHGRYLRVDLDQGTASWVPLPEEVLRRFLGGVGLGTWLLHREAPAGVEPFAPEAPLIFSLSPLVGTPLTTSAKFAVVAKSPLTERLNDALSSSHFALAAKKAGFDALVIAGCCPVPSTLIIEDGRVRLESAADLWGLPAAAANALLQQRLGPAFQTAVIGPAGEKLVRFATISHANRHAGRGGLGAVLGAKKLKAVAVAGGQHLAVADPDAVLSAARELSQRSFGQATAKYRELGTVANLLAFNRLAALPTRNFQQGTFADAGAISGEALNAAHRLARRSCAACTIGCEHIYRAPAGEVRLEYETLFALGSLCGIGDRQAILQAAHLCDQFGLDTISTGGCIAFAMECAERGLLQEPELRFGRADKMLELIEKIGRRQGLGDLLAEGTRRAAASIGGPALDFAPQVKGLEIPGYEPRTLQTMALGFAVGSRGADHNRSGAYEIDFSPQADRLHGTPGSARLAVGTEDRAALLDSLILCKFLRGVFTDLFADSADLLARVTGWKVTADELHATAQRIVTARKLFNIREGWTAAEDTLPKRFLAEGLPTAERRGQETRAQRGAERRGQETRAERGAGREETRAERGTTTEARLPPERLQDMIQAYYHARGWDAQGLVPVKLIQELSLGDLGTG